MPIVRAPDGRKVRFPDNMPREEIKKIIAEKFPDAFADRSQQSYSALDAQTAQDALGAVTSFDRGYTLGYGKKLGGLINALGAGTADAFLTDKPVKQAYQDRYNEIVDPAKYAQEQFAEKNPVTATALELSGALVNPANKILGGFIPKGGSILPKIAGGATSGAVGGYLYGEGNDIDSSDTAILGSIVGGGIPAAGAVARAAPRVVGKLGAEVLGKTTGAGADAIKASYRAGNTRNTRFLENMRNPVNMNEVVDNAGKKLDKMKQARNRAYGEDIQFLRRSEDKIDLAPVIRNVRRTINSEAGGSSYMIDTDTGRVFEKVKNILNNFYKDTERHNVAGFDDLKKAIRNIKTPPGERAEMVKNQIANTIEDQIVKQSPSYKKIMDRYAADSAAIDELKRTFSLDVRANPETTLRKLQSITRNNANTDYGYRTQLLSRLDPAGEIADAVAGSALSSYAPRGLLAQGFGATSLYTHNPLALAASSPRLMGELAYGLGKLGSKGGKSLSSALPVIQKYTPQAVRNSVVNSRSQKQPRKNTSLMEFIARPKKGKVSTIIDENGNVRYIFGR